MALGEQDDESQRARPSADASLVVGALYALAADPAEWRSLLDALGAKGPNDPAAQAALAAMVAGGERVATLASAAQAETSAGETSSAGVVILAPNGRRLAANGMVDLSALAPLGLGGADDDGYEREVLAEARQRLERGGGRPVIINLAASDDMPPAFGYLTPFSALAPRLRAGLTPAGVDAPGALAVVAPIALTGEAFWDGVGEAFSLTAAEVRLVGHLAGGASLKETSEALNVSVHTVRNQLSSIFEKTGINRQTHLVRALAELATVSMAPETAAATPRKAETPTAAPVVESIRLSDGRRLAFREYGVADGRPVLVFHAGVGASLLPPGTDARCRDLGLRLVAPDRPGIGRSDPRAHYSIEGVADDLAQLATDLALGPVQLCSYTSGSRFALATAERLGDAVSRVLMLSPRPPQTAEAAASPSPMVAFQGRMMGHPWLAEQVFAVMRLRLSRPIISQMMRASALGAGDIAYLAAHPDATDQMTEALREALAVTARGTADELRHAGAEIRPSRDLRAPITVWQGAEDTYASSAEVETWLGDHLETLRSVPGIGNYLIQKHWSEALGWLAGAN